MSDPHAPLSLAEARARIAAAGRPTAAAYGVETEWLTVPTGRPGDAVSFERMVAAAEPDLPLAGGGRITFEPGGQLEVSSAPAATAEEAVRSASADLADARRRAAGAGVELVGLGLDWRRPDRRVLSDPRYAAMETYFDGGGPHGRRMMCRTASIQPNVPLGADPAATWRLVHLLGPVLAAAFANSPLCGTGFPSGWQSARLATWWAMDPTRTAPVAHAAGTDPGEAWADYVLDAHVMLIRRDGRWTSVVEPLPFRRWIIDGHAEGRPTADDLDYHLTTLFPPIRPRGWLELRMVDALPEPWWPVPLLVVDAALRDPGAAAAVAATCADAEGRWVPAARAGMADEALRTAATAVFDAALAAMARAGTSSDLVALVAAYADRYPRRGRGPADDRLDEWTAGGEGAGAAAAAHDAELSWR